MDPYKISKEAYGDGPRPGARGPGPCPWARGSGLGGPGLGGPGPGEPGGRGARGRGDPEAVLYIQNQMIQHNLDKEQGMLLREKVYAALVE